MRLECAGPLSQTIGGGGNKREDDTEESGNQRPFPGGTLWVLDLAVPEAGLAPKGFSQVSQYIFIYLWFLLLATRRVQQIQEAES